ncbi:MAG: cytidylate kinase-like family protein [Verrucomicrobiia bacterium]|jgi:cytidylate kinase
MIRIIAIEREYGAGGSVIAEKLAEHLGWKLMDRQITEEIARMAKVTPATVEQREGHLDPLLYRLGRVFWRGSYERSLPVDEHETFDADRMVAIVQQIVEQAAATGNCVIVGRGSPYFLRDRADTLRVFLFAPREFKFRFVLTHTKNAAEANELLDSIDRDRKDFLKHYFGVEWPHRPLYHTMLNTALGNDLVLATILHLMDALNKKETSL